MHSPTLANDFSSRLTVAFAPFRLLLSHCARCLPSKSPVLILLRTLFLSLHSFRHSPRLFSIACGLFSQNTGGVGTSATSPRSLRLPVLQAGLPVLQAGLPVTGGPARYRRVSALSFAVFLSPLYFHPLTNPSSSRIDLQRSLFSCIYKSLFPQLLCIHIYTKRPGVTPSATFPPTVSTSLLRKFSFSSIACYRARQQGGFLPIHEDRHPDRAQRRGISFGATRAT